MTIDEAIQHCKEVAKKERSKLLKAGDMYICTECAEEHEQLAKWLEELKEYRIAFDLLLKDDCLNDKDWLGTLDELYEGRKEYYLNKAKEKLKAGGINE